MPLTPKFNVKVPSVSLPHVPIPSRPSLPTLPSSAASIDTLKNAVDNARSRMERSLSSGSTESDEVDKRDTSTLEPVYIVLRPLNLMEAPQAYLKRLGRVVKAIEFENYLILQHWGVLIGDRYYHLHINDETQKISVSMVPFVNEAQHQRHTIKFPIWRTSLPHEERVGIAVGIIKSMGHYDAESDVEITDETGNTVKPEDRVQYTMEGRYLNIPVPTGILQRGKYNALTNNCIHFTRHYVFEQILMRRREIKHFTSNIKWLVVKWREMGCRRGPIELTKFISGILGIGNPLTMTPDKGARLLVKLLSIFLNIEYNPVLDKKLLADSTSEEALEEVSDISVEAAQAETDPNALPIPELQPGEEEEEEEQPLEEGAHAQEVEK